MHARKQQECPKAPMTMLQQKPSPRTAIMVQRLRNVSYLSARIPFEFPLALTILELAVSKFTKEEGKDPEHECTNI